MTEEIGTVLGVDFKIHYYPTDGFQLTLNHCDTGEVLYDNRMIFYSVWEAVCRASSQVWAQEMEQHNDYDLPSRIATALRIPETYFD
jgi:hypothetical protein